MDVFEYLMDKSAVCRIFARGPAPERVDKAYL